MSIIGNPLTVGGSGGADGLNNCLRFSSPSSFTMKVYDGAKHWDGSLEWTDGVNGWKTWNGTTVLSASEGFLALRGTGNSVITGGTSADYRWSLTGSDIRCDGNIETLLDYATVANGNHPLMGTSCFARLFNGAPLTSAPALLATTLADNCYREMFRGCTSLKAAQTLPATTLTNYCYYSMFRGCTSLTTAPAILATTIASGCCYYMFSGCTSIKSPPELPATTIANSCYQEMFSGCTSLTSAPALPATALAMGCYNSMFANCTSLTTIPALPASALAINCYSSMFFGCTSLTTAPALPATTLAQNCYSSMFFGCTSLRMSQSQGGDYQYVYRLPMSGVGTIADGALSNMFYSTGGTFTGTPTINTTYYTTRPPIAA